jgi:hypothetical protein
MRREERVKQYPKSKDTQFYIQNINPVEWHKPINTVGESNDLAYAVRRCKGLAENDALQARYLSFYRVIEHRGEVVFLSHVNFQTVTHYDMREKLKVNQKQE